MNFFAKKSKEIEEKFLSTGKPLEKFFPLFEAMDTFLLTPGKTTQKAPHVRDAVDIKRVMIFVVLGLVPCICMGIYNVGYQMQMAKAMPYDFWQCIIDGLIKVVPIILVSYAAGGFWEVLFSLVRRQEINE